MHCVGRPEDPTPDVVLPGRVTARVAAAAGRVLLIALDVGELLGLVESVVPSGPFDVAAEGAFCHLHGLLAASWRSTRVPR